MSNARPTLPTQSAVFVTGATGFVGRRLVESLLKDNARVRILRQGPLPVPEGWLDVVDIRDGDLTQPASLEGLFRGIDVVYHLAGEIRDASLFDSVNRAGTENLLRICSSEGAGRFLYFSSVGVIGAGGKPGTVDEETPPRPKNAYEKSKYAGECLALNHHQNDGLRVSVIRPSIIYGEGKDPKTDSFFSLLRALDAGRFAGLGKKHVNSYVYVGDVAAAALWVANHPRTGGQAYIINEPIPLPEFFKAASELLGKKKAAELPPGIGDAAAVLLSLTGRFGSLYNRTVYSMEKLSRLGFELPFGHREGLRRTVAWYRSVRGGEPEK